ncbi:MAG TPA: PilZ domain-containing protein, partial [Nitrospiria bacterium]
ISLGGLEFYSEEAVKTGTMLKISLFFMDTEGNELSENLKGEVRWFAPFRESFIAGVQFSEIVSKENYPRLFDYIKKSEEYFN